MFNFHGLFSLIELRLFGEKHDLQLLILSLVKFDTSDVILDNDQKVVDLDVFTH